MDVDLDSRYVTLLSQICKENDFFPPVFKLVNNWGIGGVVRVRVSAGFYSREATAETELKAREIAAEHIYRFLLKRTPLHHDSSQAVSSAAESVSPQDPSERSEDRPKRRKRNTGVTDYPCSLINQFEEHKRISAVEAMNSTPNPELQVTRAATVLGLEVMWEEMPTRLNVTVLTLQLPSPMPPLVFLGENRNDAASQLAKHLKQELLEKKNVPLLG